MEAYCPLLMGLLVQLPAMRPKKLGRNRDDLEHTLEEFRSQNGNS